MEMAYGRFLTLAKARQLGVLDAAQALTRQDQEHPWEVVTPADVPVQLRGDGKENEPLAEQVQEAALSLPEDREQETTQMKEIYGLAADHMAGSEQKPPKHIKEIRTRKTKHGYIHEHHHTLPEHHPMEEHTSPDQDAMAAHMLQHIGETNPGEAEADARQAGTPAIPAAAVTAPAAGE